LSLIVHSRTIANRGRTAWAATYPVAVDPTHQWVLTGGTPRRLGVVVQDKNQPVPTSGAYRYFDIRVRPQRWLHPALCDQPLDEMAVERRLRSAAHVHRRACSVRVERDCRVATLVKRDRLC